jgi:hypothetical protein
MDFRYGIGACIYEAALACGGSMTVSSFLGVDIPRFFRISAASGLIFVR